MSQVVETVVHPPETLEGWFALHQVFAVDRRVLRTYAPMARVELAELAGRALNELREHPDGGWSATAPLVGSRGEVMLVHFRPTLEALGDVERRLRREPLYDVLVPVYTFLSVTEAGLYHVTAELAREAAARGGAVGDDPFRARVAERASAERESPHVRKRLFPELPDAMPYVCFYPMTKRRDDGQNWYTLPLEERSRLMYAHGATGRRYAGQVLQIITGAIGLDAWEWGVTLFAREPLSFKKLVTDMRFDEVSAKYAEFGDFYVGKVAEPEAWAATLMG
jgi:hydrogen peroxide-dependent heme synthase